MRIASMDDWHHAPTGLSEDTSLSQRTEACEHLLQLPQDTYQLKKIALHSRILIIEGISGSGKDTFQSYLKTKLKNRDVYDYSEGELLQSWKQLHVEGMFKLRIKFMKLFLKYMKSTINRDENAVFLLNRFHLSTYVSTIVKQPKLAREYDGIINVLRTLSAHVFILQLDEHQIKERSAHPERSTAWEKHRKQIVQKERFRDTLERHIWQQQLILETAGRQRIPYSLIKLTAANETDTKRARVSRTFDIYRPSVRVHTGGTATSSSGRELPEPSL